MTSGGGAGSWIELRFPSPTPLDGEPFDRLNVDDQVTGATLQFSYGGSVPVQRFPITAPVAPSDFQSAASHPCAWVPDEEFNHPERVSLGYPLPDRTGQKRP